VNNVAQIDAGALNVLLSEAFADAVLEVGGAR
jgi:hypothetical protein